MRRGSLAGLLALVLAGVAAPGAHAASFLSFGLAGSTGRVVSETTVPARAHGSVVVSFHGDLGTGCAVSGVCGLRGTLTYRPQDGGLQIQDVRVNGHSAQQAQLDLPGTSRTSARWPAPAPPCADTDGHALGLVQLAVERGTVTLALVTPAAGAAPAFAGRCGGPLLPDLAVALPAQDVAVAILRQGRRRIDLGGAHPFATGGLAGTVTSTVALDLGAPRRTAADSAPRPGARFRRLRELSVRYRLVSLTGTTTTTFRGRAAPDACTPLGSCGASGSLSTRPVPGRASMTVAVQASVRRPLRDLRTALGLSTAGNAAGLLVIGAAEWRHDAGSVEESLVAPGRPACHDSRPLGQAELVLFRLGGALRMAYGLAVTPADPLRTRCPGPTTSDLVEGRGLAFVRLARGAMARRVVRLRLDRRVRFTGEGYAGVTTPDLTVTLRRLSVRSRIVREQVPPGF